MTTPVVADWCLWKLGLFSPRLGDSLSSGVAGVSTRFWKPCIFSGRRFKGTWGHLRDAALTKGMRPGQERVFVRGGCHWQWGQEEMGCAVGLKGGHVGQAVPAGCGVQVCGTVVL